MDGESSVPWTSGLPSPPLADSEVHIVLFALTDGTEAAGFEWLDADEQARACRFVRRVDARHFIAAHAMVRFVLGRCTDAPPASLRFTAGPRGKPSLRDADIDLRFNLSHAGGLAVLAIALGREVGVDIERECPIEVMELAGRFFSSGESRALAALPSDDRLAAFYRCWARKESFIKARGDGLSFPLDGFEVSLGRASQLIACSAAPSELQRWTMASLPVDEGYAAALTVDGRGWSPRLWRSPPLAIAFRAGA